MDDIYKGSFFPQTIKDWNALPESVIATAEVADDIHKSSFFPQIIKDWNALPESVISSAEVVDDWPVMHGRL